MRLPRRAVIGIVVLVIGGLGFALFRVATGADTPAQSTSGLDEIRATLRDRDARLTRGDVEGFLRPLAPAARAFETPFARGSRMVPLVEIKMAAIPGRFQEFNATHFPDLPINVTYQYRDIPTDNKFEYRYLSTFEKQGGAWVVTSSKPAPPEFPNDPRPIPPVWARGPVQVDRSGHFLTIFRPGLQHEKEAVALAEQARVQLAPKLLLEPDPVHVMELAGSNAQMGEMSQSDVFEALGLASFRFSDDRLPFSRYMLLDVSALVGKNAVTFDRDDTTPIQVAQHELGHLGLFRYMTPETPSWLNEGGAMYLSGERLKRGWREGLADGSIQKITIADLERLPQIPADAYPYANAAVLALIQAAGPQQFFYYFRGYKDLPELQGGLSNAKEPPTDVILQVYYQFQRTKLDLLTVDFIRAAVAAG